MHLGLDNQPPICITNPALLLQAAQGRGNEIRTVMAKTVPVSARMLPRANSFWRATIISLPLERAHWPHKAKKKLTAKEERGPEEVQAELRVVQLEGSVSLSTISLASYSLSQSSWTTDIALGAVHSGPGDIRGARSDGGVKGDDGLVARPAHETVQDGPDGAECLAGGITGRRGHGLFPTSVTLAIACSLC